MAAIITERYGEPGSILDKYEMCDALGMSGATFYRMTRKKRLPVEKKKPYSPGRLTQFEEDKVLALLNGPGFCDMAPAELVNRNETNIFFNDTATTEIYTE